MIFRLLVTLRGAIGLAFGIFFLTHTAITPTEGFVQGGYYAAIDGCAALLCALGLFGMKSRVAGISFFDGCVRIGIGVYMIRNPWIEQNVVGWFFFIAALFTTITAIGGMEVLYFIFRRADLGGADGWPWASFLSAALTLTTGACLISGVLGNGIEERRYLFGFYALALGATLLISGLRPRKKARVTHPSTN